MTISNNLKVEMVFLLIEVRTAESSYLNYCDICQHQSRVIKQVQISLSKFGWLGRRCFYALLHVVYETYQTKTTKLNQTNKTSQRCQIKPIKPNQTKLSQPNLSKQTYRTEQTNRDLSLHMSSICDHWLCHIRSDSAM